MNKEDKFSVPKSVENTEGTLYAKDISIIVDGIDLATRVVYEASFATSTDMKSLEVSFKTSSEFYEALERAGYEAK